jgi:hypothetical protein
MPGVLQIQTYGDRLHVFVDDLNERRAAIEAALGAAGVSVQSTRTTRARMEEAFISLIREREEA